MSYDATLEPVARWTATADADSPQGADGTGDLISSAYRNLLAAEWQPDGGAPFLPVHTNEQERPTGQAFRCGYGYDASARTQMCAMGAECYTYAIPADALDSSVQASGDDPGGVASVVSVSVSISVDRYCDDGALVVPLLSDRPAPPPLPMALAAAQGSEAFFPALMQTDDDGQPLPSNKRVGQSGAVSASVGLAAQRYLHVVLLLAGYNVRHAERKSWVEGGAVFAAEAATVSFGRVVAPDAAQPVAEGAMTPMTLGELGSGNSPTVYEALAMYPMTRLWLNLRLAVSIDATVCLADESAENSIRNLLAYLFTTPALYGGASTIIGSGAVSLSRIGEAGFATASRSGQTTSGANVVKACALVVHGLTRGRTFRGVRFQYPLNPSGGSYLIPYRVALYGLDPMTATSPTTNYPPSATPIPHWSALMDRAVRGGKARSIKFLTTQAVVPVTDNGNTVNPEISSAALSSSAAAERTVTPLAVADIDGECQAIPFDKPWTAPEMASVVMVVVPDGLPSSAASAAVSHDAALTRTVRVTLPNSGASAVTRAAISHSAARNMTNFDCLYHAEVTLGTLQKAGLFDWPTDGRFPRYGTRTKTLNLPVKIAVGTFSVNSGGKTYTYTNSTLGRADDNTIWYDWAAETRAAVSVSVQTVAGNDYDFIYIRTGELQLSASVVASATDGSTIKVNVAPRSMPLSWSVLEIPARNVGHLVGNNAFDVYQTNSQYVVCFRRQYSTWFGSETESLSSSAFSLTWVHGYAHEWASASNGTVSGTLGVTGRVSAVIDDVEYSADLPALTAAAAIMLTDKDGATVSAGASTSQTARVVGTVPAWSGHLTLVSSSGAKIGADVSVPAQVFDSLSESWGGPTRFWASCAYAGLPQAVARRSQDSGNSGATATVTGTAAMQDIDLGTVSLYE